MKIITRDRYLNRLVNVMNTPDIKVITGVRRSGKSKLMDAFIELLEKQEDNNIIRIKLNLKSFEKLKNPDELYNYVESNYKENYNNYLLIDEIQLCNNFESIINSLHEEEKFDIYLTGANAFLLSSDLATLFGGRVFEINMFPFSFEEYRKYYQDNDIDQAFEEYFLKGGMSGSYLYHNKEDAINYINNILKSTITKDIITKYKVENPLLLSMIEDFLMDNLGSKTSIRNIANKLTANTYKTNDKTVGAYIDYLCKSFLFYPFTRYDIKGKKYLESDKKYYLVDLSFRYAELGTKNIDYGYLYENLVAMELLRRGFEVYVGVLFDKEVDFVAVKQGEKTYIQVCDDITNKTTFEREVGPLLSIRDAFPKMIIARTKHPKSQYEGIKIIDIARWLSHDEE
ncbi:MAG: ATP-binding protein [Bacilli bacterium]|nr:ATP-binding protein [Bacilli bacterium]